MSRAYRVVLLVPAVLAVMNVLALVAGASPCMPGEWGCVNP